MRIIYISFINESIRPGYVKKIYSQSKSFYNNGLETWLISRESECFKLISFSKNNSIEEKRTNIDSTGKGLSKYINYITALSKFLRFSYDIIKEIQPDAVYIRRIRPITPVMLRYIKKMKKDGILVFYEYPTYPWKEEYICSKQYLSLIIDSIFWRGLQRNISALVCMGKCEKKTCDVIETMNGIDVSSISSRSITRFDNVNEVNMICVCHYSVVHGIEKVVKGMAEYYSVERSCTFKLHLVGPIEGFESLKRTVDISGLSKYVLFYGFKTGGELDQIYEQANIGLDAIALEIRGEKCICGSLKSREYILKGIPFVCSDMLDIVCANKNVPGFMYVMSHKEDALNIEKVVNWYLNGDFDTEEIQAYGRNTLSWEKTMLPVVEYCINNKI